LSRILEPTRVEVETNKFECSSLSFSKGKEVGEEREKVICNKIQASILDPYPFCIWFQ
jgi:hypothetical protein